MLCGISERKMDEKKCRIRSLILTIRKHRAVIMTPNFTAAFENPVREAKADVHCAAMK